MKNETSCRVAARRSRRPLALLAFALLASLSLGGCSFLADEFTTLDRAAPSALIAPDAPTNGLEQRP
jgi:hypothetical protein